MGFADQPADVRLVKLLVRGAAFQNTGFFVDGFNVPNYENRDPAPKYQMPFTSDDSMKFIQVPAEFKSDSAGSLRRES